MARRQTAGYGRRGRGWAQEAGDLAASLVLPLNKGTVGGLVETPALFGFALSLALAETVDALNIPASLTRVKWPNDVLIDGAKLSGILLEREEAESGAMLVAGIGVNIVHKPDIVDYPTARLVDHLTGTPPAPEELLDLLDRRLQHHLAGLSKDGFAPLRTAWLARAARRGEAVTVRLPRETQEGTFEGLDENGNLLLRQGDTLRSIATGDVFFGAACASTARS